MSHSKTKRTSSFTLLSLVAVLAFGWVLAGSVTFGSLAYAQTSGTVPGESLGNQSDSDFWRGIRHGTPGKVSIPDQKAAVMINSSGQDWREFHNGPVTIYGGGLILLSLFSLIAFGFYYGRFKLSGRSGRVIPRFSQAERWVHWFVAALFIILGLTGVLILFAKFVLIPIIGKSAAAVIVNASLQAHNLFGPIFVVALAIMLIIYLKDNLFQKGDFVWAIKGGFFNKHHPPSWKYNLGEKSWYWLIVFAGTALSVSGILLDFPTFIDGLEKLQLAQIVHSISALALIAASLGHIYLGVYGVEGALEGMTVGYVDETWAKEHHRWWAEKEIKRNRVVEGAPDAVLAANKAKPGH